MNDESKQPKAAAIKYDPEKDHAPRVTATGTGETAVRIIEAARSCGVPIHEDATLVDLLSLLDLGTEIPPALYGVVAEVLAFIYQLDRSID